MNANIEEEEMKKSMGSKFEGKSFTDLINEVQNNNLCGQCMGCVTFCSAAELEVLGVNEEGFPHYIQEDKCLKDGLCYVICHKIKDLEPEIKEDFNWVPPFGHYERITSAQSTDPRVLEVCTDGGVVTSLLGYMLDKNIISGALVAKKTGVLTREPAIAKSYDEVIDAAGFYFIHPKHMEMLGDRYTTYSPMFSRIKDFGDTAHARFAFVGVPCQVDTIRKMQKLKILPAHIITFVIGLFCWENFFFESLVNDKLKQKELGFSFDNIKKINIKENLIVTFKDGRILHIPFEEVDDFARPACLACTDFANDFADISVGGLASPDGFTTTLLRTQKGRELFEKAVRADYIREIRIDTSEVLSKIADFTKKKITRGENRIADVKRTKLEKRKGVE
ncbi:MAG: coenzyme F420 hydrogenase [Candidatus Cloacimonadota bacterium]|nr:MAG: coenzyme F420 hydrogenase [Candidatus Cloacimonadota bacterium]